MAGCDAAESAGSADLVYLVALISPIRAKSSRATTANNRNTTDIYGAHGGANDGADSDRDVCGNLLDAIESKARASALEVILVPVAFITASFERQPLE